jgi:serine/threonine protein kinase
VDNQFEINQGILVQMVIQIADVMSYVASKRIVHADLDCRHVLVFHVDSAEPRNCLVKITDFGLARCIDQSPADEDSRIIPIRYCAPEILRDNRHSTYSDRSDVYSMGALLWEALSNDEMPYSSVDEDYVVKQMKLDKPTTYFHGIKR